MLEDDFSVLPTDDIKRKVIIAHLFVVNIHMI